jgi:ABC-type uncharacterized transport system involved in gliding motility auxiliary subunit
MNEARASLDRIWTIARRELKAMFDHPTGYILLVVFVAANSFLFFRQAYLMSAASLRPMLDLLPWMLLFFVPAVSMRVIAEETRTGMLEVVLTQPITDIELLAGKYLGALVFLLIGLALTLPIPIGLTLGSKLHWGPIVAQYIGAGLLVFGLAGVGVWASTLAKSQITAFILAVAVTFVLVLVGLDPLIVGLGPTAGAIAARLGVLSHFESIGRGVIDLRDAIYFLSVGGVFLALAYGALVSRRLSSVGTQVKRLRAGVVMIVACLVVVNLAGGYIGGRLDLTPGKAYTLSSATKQIVGSLDDIVTIKMFASDELPTSVALLKRQMDDLLRDLKSASHGKIRIVRRNPSSDQTAKSDAQALGIGPIQFNVIGQSELSVKEGYLGLAVQYGNGNEAIPFVSRGDDLEYRLVAAIRALTHTKKPVLGVVAGAPDPTSSGDGLEVFHEELGKSYDVRSISLGDSTQPAADVNTIVFAGAPEAIPPGAADRIQKFFHRGGSALVLGAGMQLAPQAPMAMPREFAWNAILKPFGVSVKTDMVYDLASADVVPVPTSFGVRVLQRYPLFVRAQSTEKSVVNADVSDVLLPWPSSIDTTHSAAWAITPLFVSSRSSGTLSGETTIEPTHDFPQTNLAPRLLAVQVAPASSKDTSAHGRVIVVASGEMARSGFADRVQQNSEFVLNAIDWLAQDESLIAIRAKDTQPPALAFTSAAEREGVKYVNMIGVPALIALYGLIRLARRRGKTRDAYQRSAVRAEEALA